MNEKMTVQGFIMARPHLVWDVRDLKNLSEASIVEHTLNYGTWRDVQELLALLGTDRAGKIFLLQQQSSRSNYRPEIAHYFQLYFTRYATH